MTDVNDFCEKNACNRLDIIANFRLIWAQFSFYVTWNRHRAPIPASEADLELEAAGIARKHSEITVSEKQDMEATQESMIPIWKPKNKYRGNAQKDGQIT